ncbi:hypothetical protein [Novosphingobium sp. P6W]|uniref:hypothetical protein n=1 Tax=Novosphingobium sp. P6W TaxID=1609758 RepID=UPI0005C30B34|nr:hypothetical protein [Novosphingobium sp. P6W]AXB75468.1 hypothetical protein TQ38_002190 [Novosphingobium sp. P6W]KIS32506.1 hypothetical protein TQ38_09220 [Novosphingobium sp. P6W]
MVTANPIITMVVGTAPGVDGYLPLLAAHYGATRTHDGWPGEDLLEPGDLVLVDEVPDLNMIAINVILLPDNRGVLFQEIELADALADILPAVAP